jgi:hypothetical protein
MFLSEDSQEKSILEYLSYRRKRAWIEIGNWMDNAKPNDEFPFKLSSSERKIIEAVVIATTKKRNELMRIGIVFIESNKPDFRWSDLVAYPDVQKAIKSIGFSEETWVEGVLPMLLRMRPSSVAIRQMQIIANVKQELLILHCKHWRTQYVLKRKDIKKITETDEKEKPNILMKK